VRLASQPAGATQRGKSIGWLLGSRRYRELAAGKSQLGKRICRQLARGLAGSQARPLARALRGQRNLAKMLRKTPQK